MAGPAPVLPAIFSCGCCGFGVAAERGSSLLGAGCCQQFAGWGFMAGQAVRPLPTVALHSTAGSLRLAALEGVLVHGGVLLFLQASSWRACVCLRERPRVRQVRVRARRPLGLLLPVGCLVKALARLRGTAWTLWSQG